MNKDSVLAARGIGMLAVVIGHLQVAYPFPTVYYWHIPLFFFLVGAGMLKPRTWKQTISYVAKDVLLYLLAWHIVYGTLVYFVPPFSMMDLHFPHEPFLSVVTTDIVRLNSHAVGPLAPLWFLTALAGVTILCTLITKIIPKAGLLPAGAVLLAGGWLLGNEQGYVLTGSFPLLQAGQILLGSGFALVGAAFFGSDITQRWALKGTTTVCAVVLAGLLLSRYNPIPINLSGMSVDDNILSSVAIALCGIQVVLWLAHQVRSWVWLCYLGKQSKAIMTHHLLGVALSNLLLVAVGALTLDLVGTYTVHEPQTLWLLYLAVGLLVPLSIVAIQAAVTKRLRA